MPLSVKHDYRFDPFTKADNAIDISSEEQAVPSNTPYYIDMEEVPRENSPSSITAYDVTDGLTLSEVSGVPASGEFDVDYEYETGKIRFNAAQAGNTIRFDYKGTGHVIAGTFINILSDWLGKSYTVENDHDHDNVNSAPIASLPNDIVTTVALKTSTGEVSRVATGSETLTLPGGEYGFYPQFKQTGASTHKANIDIFLFSETDVEYQDYTSYATLVRINATLTVGETFVAYLRQRYVTASGKDYFIFLLYDKITQKVLSCYSAPDHPCYGNGDDESIVPHPFANYWNKPLPSNLEIILVEKNIAKEIQKKATRNKGAVDIINEDYKLDTNVEFKKDLDISNYEGHHRNLQNLHKDIKYRKLKTK